RERRSPGSGSASAALRCSRGRQGRAISMWRGGARCSSPARAGGRAPPPPPPPPFPRRRSGAPGGPGLAAGGHSAARGAGAVVAAATGEWTSIHHVSTESILSLVYLIAMGSWLAFTCYAWLLRSTRTSLVSTYAYVNPLVAVFLGLAVEREPISARTVVAGL